MNGRDELAAMLDRTRALTERLAAGDLSALDEVSAMLADDGARIDELEALDGEAVSVAEHAQGGVVHELVVVRAESVSDLPTEGEIGTGNYPVIESDLPAGAVVGEIEDIALGSSKDLTLDLDAGSYVLICNLVGTASDGDAMEGRSHFAEGMYAEFTVN